MTVYQFNPLNDSRWNDFVLAHGQASIFHTSYWLTALQRSYGYEPIVFTTSAPDQPLQNGVLFCEVRSWVTGKRLVSLPFSDHCQPLMENADLQGVLAHLADARAQRKWRYVELRPLTAIALPTDGVYGNGTRFSFHRIDLGPEIDAIYKRFHDSCIRRKIRKAEREELTYESGNTPDLLAKFHSLLLITRRRHKLPPQPRAWFKNLTKSLGDKLTIRVLSKGSAPVAAILTLSFRDRLMYKYGCSDGRFHNLGGMPLLFWKAVQEAKQAGMSEIDLGRSSDEDAGLVAFKGHLGGEASHLQYFRSPVPKIESPSGAGVSIIRSALAKLPDSTFAGAGSILYKHLG